MPNYSGVWLLQEALDAIAQGNWPFSPGNTPPFGLISYGYNGSTYDNTNVDRINISTTGNAVSFGDLTYPRILGSAFSSTTVGHFVTGRDIPAGNAYPNTIEYISFSSGGTATDFGDAVTEHYGGAALSNSVRGVIAAGIELSTTNRTNIIEYVTMASAGNGTDFGDLNSIRSSLGGNVSSSTRGLFYGGSTGTDTNVIEYITIDSTGNASDFGDLQGSGTGCSGFSSTTRGVMGCFDSSGPLNRIDYVTIASTGNASDFGDLLTSRFRGAGCSSTITGAFCGGRTDAAVNVIESVTIATTGNATDFGDLTTPNDYSSACSNAHGGLA